MNKKGFTLIELLVVLAIVAVASAGSILVFDRADAESSKKELKETYVRIQRAAKIYLDMNDSWRNQFNDKEYIYIKMSELQNENFIETNLIDPTEYKKIDSNNLIVIYVNRRTEGSKVYESVDSCIITNDASKKCISNSYGDACNCCTGFADVGNWGSENNKQCK